MNGTIFERAKTRTLLCAHRGVSGGNVPCNTTAAFAGALAQGADIIELDVAKSRDGEFFVFHPGMEHAHLHSRKPIALMKASEVKRRRFVNQDDTKTQFGVERLDDVLDFLKGKCYINVDKYWTDVPGITQMIRKTGVEEQVIVKSGFSEKALKQLQEHAPDLMYMPIIRDRDDVTQRLLDGGVRCIGAEVLFREESAPVASDAYIEAMHQKGLLLFVNAIVYDYKEVLSAGHTDDVSVAGEPEKGWGWLLDKGFDIIQTDWCGMVKSYMENRNLLCKFRFERIADSK